MRLDGRGRVEERLERAQPAAVYVEDAASGQSLVQELGEVTRLPIVPVRPDRDKVARVHAVSPTIEQLKKEGEQGRKTINQYTRYLTVWLATFQA